MPKPIRKISVGFCPNSCLVVCAPSLGSLPKIYVLSFFLFVGHVAYPRPKTCFNFFSSLPRTLVGTLRALILPFDLPTFKCLAKPRRRKSFPVPVIFILRLIDFLIFSFLFFVFIYYCFLTCFDRRESH